MRFGAWMAASALILSSPATAQKADQPALMKGLTLGDWTLLDEDEVGQRLGRRESPAGANPRFSVRGEFRVAQEDEGKRYLSLFTTYELRCADKASRVQASAIYARNNLASPVEENTTPGAWRPIDPKGIESDIYDSECAGSSEATSNGDWLLIGSAPEGQVYTRTARAAAGGTGVAQTWVRLETPANMGTRFKPVRSMLLLMEIDCGKRQTLERREIDYAEPEFVGEEPRGQGRPDL
jgi:hypothetical protein